MSGSSGFGQLIKGIFIGVVLILAVIGTMSMLEKKDDSAPNSTTTPEVVSAPEIKAPEISIDNQASEKTTPPESSDKSAISNNNTNSTNNYIPVLEGEKTAEEVKKIETEEKIKAIKYGTIKLSTINSKNNESLNANYAVFDSNNVQVAESKNTNNASYRLPVGRYKVITTLIKSANTSTRKTEPVQTSQMITVIADKLSKQVFKLEPPSNIGVLQVSATNAKNKQAMKANFVIQKENGEIIATRKNVSRSLFKLKAGSYKVTVKSGNNSDFRTIVVEPGESVSEVFSLQEATLQGRVLVRVFDTKSTKPVTADIIISTSAGKKVQELTSVSQTEIALPAGNYKIKVKGPNGQSTKNISVIAGKAISEIFRFDAPQETQITDDVKITAVEPEKNTTESDLKSNAEQAQNQPTDTTLGRIKLFAKNAGNQKPLKSNFYIQTQNGKNIDKKIYADNAEFNLKPGKYKLTIRSKNRKNIVKVIQIVAGKSISQTFSLYKPNSNKTTAPVSTPSKTTSAPKAIPNGFLNVSMQPARNTHFIIANRAGKKVVELTSVPSGNFKLDTGVYIVTAILNNQRRKQTIQVHQGKTTRLNFNANNFQAKRAVNNAIPKGVLRSRIVDNAGRPLRGDLTVTNRRGQIVARANGVTVGLFNLPPEPHTVIVNYRGLSGSEKVKITAGQTTVQTFTITPNNSRPAQATPAPARQKRDPKDILRDKIEEELRRIF